MKKSHTKANICENAKMYLKYKILNALMLNLTCTFLDCLFKYLQFFEILVLIFCESRRLDGCDDIQQIMRLHIPFVYNFQT